MADELNKPSRGTGDWDIPLNQNFDTLEAAARAFLPRGTTETLNVADVNSDSISNSAQVTTQDMNVQGQADITDLKLSGSITGILDPVSNDPANPTGLSFNRAGGASIRSHQKQICQQQLNANGNEEELIRPRTVGDPRATGVINVRGQDLNGANNFFFDTVAISGGTTLSVIHTINRDNPNARSYSAQARNSINNDSIAIAINSSDPVQISVTYEGSV
jgi:hypothetical protein